jgi:hypothetical protein
MRRVLNSVVTRKGRDGSVSSQGSENHREEPRGEEGKDFDARTMDTRATGQDEQERIEELEYEVVQLRESTKTALQMSWAEVERLKSENEKLSSRGDLLRHQVGQAELEMASDRRQMLQHQPSRHGPSCDDGGDSSLCGMNSSIQEDAYSVAGISQITSQSSRHGSIQEEDKSAIDDDDNYLEGKDGVWFFNDTNEGGKVSGSVTSSTIGLEGDDANGPQRSSQRTPMRRKLRLGRSTRVKNRNIEEELMTQLTNLEQDTKTAVQQLEGLLEEKVQEIKDTELANEEQNNIIESLRVEITEKKAARVEELKRIGWPSKVITLDQLEQHERQHMEDLSNEARALSTKIDNQQRQVDRLVQALAEQHRITQVMKKSCNDSVADSSLEQIEED